MRLYSLCIVLMLLLFSCEIVEKKQATKMAREVHYPDKNSPRDSIFYYDKNGYNYRIDYFNNNAFSRAEYNQSGNIEYVEVTDSLGNVYKDVKEYDQSEMLELREYKTIEEKTRLNQLKFLKSSNKELIFGKGNYYILHKLDGDTILVNQSFSMGINMIASINRKVSPSVLVIKPFDNSPNFNADFSNLDEVEVDTTYNLNIELDYRKQLGIPDGEDYRNQVGFGRYFEEVGNQNFRGILVEYYDEEVAPDSVVRREHKYYFDIPVYVKDSIDSP